MYLFSRIGHLKKLILKGRGFRCGSDEKMMRMWFGLEIDVVGLPPLGYQIRNVAPVREDILPLAIWQLFLV